jgi:hypothetical protein
MTYSESLFGIVYTYFTQSRRRSFDLRPLIEPHVRISRIRLSDGVAPLQGVRSTLSSHQPPTGCFNTQTFSAISVASFSWNTFADFPLGLRIYLTHCSVSPKQDPFAWSAFYPPSCYQPFTGTDIIATMSPSDFSYRIIPAFPSGWLYLPYLYRGRYETSLGHLTTLSSSSRP